MCECVCVSHSVNALYPSVWPSVTVSLFEVILLFVEFVDLFAV